MDKKSLKKRLNAAWTYRVIERDGNKCQFPMTKKCTNIMQAHHIFHKGAYPHMRYLKLNGITLCTACHYKIHKQGEAELLGLLQARYPDRWEYLMEKRNEIVKIDYDFLLKNLEELG